MNSALTQTLLLHLAQLGVREVCVAAGARNTPLITALLASSGVKLWNFFEERSAGFFALGRMMVDRKPVAVLTTSGTAAAELLPAVIEAYYQAQPLIVITADRPSRYRGSGAPQAIEQVGLYGTYAERTLDLEGNASDAAWPRALGSRPLHINVCLDEPLTGIDSGIDFAAWGEPSLKAKSPDMAMCEMLETFLEQRKELTVLAGGLHPSEAKQLQPALLRLGAPIIAEATANLAPCDLIVRGGEKALAALNPKRVLRIGSVPSWRWWRDLESRSGVHLMHLSNASFAGLARYQGLAVQPLSLLESAALGSATTEGLVAAGRADQSSRLSTVLEAQPLSEPAWMQHLGRAIPAGSRVFLGNSLPIREWNLAGEAAEGVAFFANRGANGIDGLISTFYGISSGAAEAWMIVGDLSTLYDLSAPWIAEQLPAGNRRIVIINNGGGKIFSRVESLRSLAAEARGMIENRHDVSFEPWAQLWKLAYRRVTHPADLRDLPDGDVIIEVIPDAEQTEAFWQAWQARSADG
jgi:2-succinyl-5-enolpyruvyl-6-hydroxy-3-cyclohexene-1-carboxylate synthase